jgi:hypothetical protein
MGARGLFSHGKGVIQQTRVQAGSNTSTVNLQVVRRDEKGSLESEAIKYCDMMPERQKSGVRLEVDFLGNGY